MILNFCFSLLLEIPIFYWLFNNFPNTLGNSIITIVYILLCLLFYSLFFLVLRKGKLVFNLKEVPENFTFIKFFVDYIVILVKYLLQGVYLQIFIETFCKDIKNFLLSILPFLILYFVFSQIIFSITRRSPIYFFVIIGIPIVLFNFVGISDTFLLGWSFISLIFLSVFSQFFSIDLKYGLNLPSYVKKYLDLDAELIKERLLRTKFEFLLMIPFIYVSLLLSEKLVYSNKVFDLFSKITNNQYSLGNLEYFSAFSLCLAILKLCIFLFLFLPCFEYRNKMLNYLSKFFLLKISKLAEENRYSVKNIYFGKFLKVKKKRKWSVNESEFFLCNEIDFEYYQKNAKPEKLGDIDIKKIRYISDDVFVFYGTYYLKKDSKTYNELIGKKKAMGYAVLKEPDPNVFIFFVIVVLLFIVFQSMC
ncbi:hypothetical protein HMPREF9387_1318 [Streptococcus sanguinis SK340]|nr:hypothetical protein HMPREF9387_1318 [Streptococcus sanguinis SK340]